MTVAPRKTIENIYQRDRANYEKKDAREVRTGSFDVSRYSQRTLAKVRARWQLQRLVEYRSTSVFLDLAKQLMEAGAAIEATAVVVRMAQDEYRHADLCTSVARTLGCSKLDPLALNLPTIARHADVSRQVAALRNVILCTSISEMNAVANFIVEIEQMTDPYLRAATRTLLGDEVLHGEFGFRYLEDWEPFLASSPREKKEVSRYLRFAFAYAERELVGAPNLRRATAEEQSLGLLDGATRRDIFLDTVANAIVPGLEAFGLDAEKAFQQRSLG